MRYGDYYTDYELEEGLLSSDERVWVRDRYIGSDPNGWKQTNK